MASEPQNWEDDGTFLEERADHLPLKIIETNTALDGPTSAIVDQLLLPGAKLLIGPRGCGKTHLMRYALVRSLVEENAPFCVYVSFNRYYHLEPLLRNRPDAMALFHGWMICLCYLGVHDTIHEYRQRIEPDVATALFENVWVDYSKDDLLKIAARLERGGSLSEEQQSLFDDLSIERLKQNVDSLLETFSKRRCVILLDDAALTLTPEYLPEFFDFFRILRSTKITPKASIYPGTTETGPRFHQVHETDDVHAWFSVEDPHYLDLMEAIGTKRFVGYLDIDADIRELLKFAAFGVPRAYLLLLRAFKKGASRPQQQINLILSDFIKKKETEYTSLSQKVPKFATLIRTGLNLWRKMCEEIALDNKKLLESASGDRQLLFGIQEDQIPHVDRMLSLLVESGLLYQQAAVSHGEDRTYNRFIPHLAALIHAKAFSRGRGFSAKAIVKIIKRPQTKHPLRRQLSSLMDANELSGLKLDLPPCQACGTLRPSERSKFCDHCGALLMDTSKFTDCMKIILSNVTGLTNWQREKLQNELPDVKTIGDFLALRDPGSRLRRMHRIGEKRAIKIAELVDAFVTDFLA